MYCETLPGYTWQCGLNYTDTKLQTLQDKNLILTLENILRGGIGSIMEDGYVQSDETKKILHVDANILYGWAMSESLPYDEIKFEGNVKSEEILNNSDDSDIGYIVEVDLKILDEITEKTKKFPLLSKIKNLILMIPLII